MDKFQTALTRHAIPLPGLTTLSRVRKRQRDATVSQGILQLERPLCHSHQFGFVRTVFGLTSLMHHRRSLSLEWRGHVRFVKILETASHLFIQTAAFADPRLTIIWNHLHRYKLANNNPIPLSTCCFAHHLSNMHLQCLFNIAIPKCLSQSAVRTYAMNLQFQAIALLQMLACIPHIHQQKSTDLHCLFNSAIPKFLSQ